MDIKPGNISLYLVINPENFGFAKGNNIGIAEALKHHADFVLLLNNDTTVDPSFSEELISFFTRNPDYGVATPQIRYFSKPDIIWNCGGRLNALGSRRYFYADQLSARVKKKDFMDVTFVTGCALCVRADVFRQFGLLTEDFFFGEEDYEFSLRIRKMEIKAACVLPSVIYHKVNTSVAKTGSVLIGKVYIHYLNRFINLKKYYSPFRWQLTRYFSVFYIFGLLFLRYRVSSAKSKKLIRLLLKNSAKMNRVGKSEFEKFIRGDFS
jgi:GT2 family glycosyltransferase